MRGPHWTSNEASTHLKECDKETKSELLKDILAFANAARQITAHILIGVEEDAMGWGKVVGVTKHLDDAKLQQFVNGKTNRPVEFFLLSVPIPRIGNWRCRNTCSKAPNFPPQGIRKDQRESSIHKTQ